MSTFYILSLAVVVVVAAIKLAELLARTHEGESFRVSDAWLNEHIRGRRDS